MKSEPPAKPASEAVKFLSLKLKVNSFWAAWTREITSTVGLWKSQCQTGPVVLLCCGHTSAEPVPSQHASFQTTITLKPSFSSLKDCRHEGENKQSATPAPLTPQSGEALTVTWVLRLMENQPHSFPNSRLRAESVAWPALRQLCLKWGPGGPS